ncbi:MAG TPA: hypothetical protein VLV31_09430 [Candidatus Acidoferrales bacterium]|nr:hypothetical protein [Candidatus Acidoferrales bacterium]
MLALVPVGFVVLVTALTVLPKSQIHAFDVWFIAGSYIALASLDTYYLAHKYKINRKVVVYFLGLTGIILVILFYVPYDVQVIAYIVTAISAVVLYVRVIIEFHRRKHA